MAVVFAVIFCFYFAFICHCNGLDPFINQGPYITHHWDDSFYLNPYQNLSYALSIYTPKHTAGNYNILLFLTGFDGDVFSHISSYGYIVVSCSILDFGGVNATLQAKDIQQTIEWINNELESNMQSHGIDTSQIKPNVTSICLGTHSGSAQAAVRLLNTTCSTISAVYLQDPVDCTNPYKPNTGCAIIPGVKLPFVIPLLHVETGLDPVSMHRAEPSCAPLSQSNQRFVNAWKGPVYQINATMFGHMDIVNAKYVHDFDVSCPSCQLVYNESNCDGEQYRNGIGGWVVSFLRMMYSEQWDYRQYLVHPRMWLENITLVAKQYYNGYPPHTSAFCHQSYSVKETPPPIPIFHQFLG
eukprot:552123_1